MRPLILVALLLGASLAILPGQAQSASFSTNLANGVDGLEINTQYSFSTPTSDNDLMRIRVTNNGGKWAFGTPSVVTAPTGVTVTCTENCGKYNYSANGGFRDIQYRVEVTQAYYGTSFTLEVPFSTDVGAVTQHVPVTVARKDAALLFLTTDSVDADLECGGQATSQMTLITVTNGRSGVQSTSANSISASLGTLPSWLTASLSGGPSSLSGGASGTWTLTTRVDPTNAQLQPGPNQASIPITVTYSTTRERNPLQSSFSLSADLPVQVQVRRDGMVVSDPVQIDFGKVYPQTQSTRDFEAREACGYRGVDLTMQSLASSPLAKSDAPASLPASGSGTIRLAADFQPGTASVCSLQRWGYRLQASAGGRAVDSQEFQLTAQPTLTDLEPKLAALGSAASFLDAERRDAINQLTSHIHDISNSGYGCQDSRLAGLAALLDPLAFVLDRVQPSTERDPHRSTAEAAAVIKGLEGQCKSLTDATDRQRCGTVQRTLTGIVATQIDSLASGLESSNARARVDGQRLLLIATEALDQSDDDINNQSAKLAQYEDALDLANQEAAGHLVLAREYRRAGLHQQWNFLDLPIGLHPLALRELSGHETKVMTQYAQASAGFLAAGEHEQATALQQEAKEFEQALIRAERLGWVVVALWVLVAGLVGFRIALAGAHYANVRRTEDLGDFLAKGAP